MADTADGEGCLPSYEELFGHPTTPNPSCVQEPLLATYSELEVQVRIPPGAEERDLSTGAQPQLVTQNVCHHPPPPYVPPLAVADCPPSYDSLFGRVMAAHNTSTTRMEFLKKFYELLRDTLGCTLFLGIIMAVPITMIVMGCMHLFDCPAEQYIPLFLVVGGVAVTAKIVKTLLEMYTCKDCAMLHSKNRGNDALEVLLIFFIIGWFIAGNMWIYRTYGRFDSKNPRSPNYCSPYVFYFAFWLTTSVYVLFALFLCCMYGLSALSSKTP